MKIRPALIWVLPYLALVVVHLAYGSHMGVPFVFSDEAGYLGRARYFAGGLPIEMLGNPDYHFGYSLLITPAFWIGDDPYEVYRWVLVTNAFLLASVYFPLFRLATSVLGIERRIAAVAATVAGLYPATMLLSNVAMSENALIPLYATLILVFSICLRRWTVPWIAGTVALAVALYIIHPRALPTAILVPLHLAVVAIARGGREYVRYAKIVVLAVVVIAPVGLLIELLIPSALSGDETFGRLEWVLRRLGDPNKWAGIAIGIAGQLWYLLASTYGVFAIGFAVVARTIHQRRRDVDWRLDPQTHVLLLVLTTSASMVFAGAVQLAPLHRFDTYIYGRYNEAFLPVFLLAGLCWVATSHELRACLRVALGTVLAITTLAIVIGVVGPDDATGTVTPLNIMSVIPFLWEAGWIAGIVSATIAAVTTFVVIMILSRTRARVVGLGVAGLLFTAITIYVQTFFFLPRQDAESKNMAIPRLVRQLVEADHIFVDVSCEFCKSQTLRFQWLVPEVRFSKFDSRESIPDGLVITSSSQPPTPRASRLADDRFDLALWNVGDRVYRRKPAPPYRPFLQLHLGVFETLFSSVNKSFPNAQRSKWRIER